MSALPPAARWILPCALAVMLALYVAYQREKRREGMQNAAHVILLKGSATFVAVLVCLYACFSKGFSLPASLLLAGVALGMIADMALCLHFLAGMGVFALGHAAYIAAFLMQRAPGMDSLAVFAFALCVLGFLFYHWRANIKERLVPFSLYAVLLCAMLALSVGQPPLLMAGAALFVISDTILARNILLRQTRLSDNLCLLCYYSGQFFIGASVFFL